MDRKDIKNFTIEELRRDMKNLSEPPYRAEQIFYLIYKRGAMDFDNMTNIPAHLKERLNRFYFFNNIRLKKSTKSSDDTEKFLFELIDGAFIETVLIYAHNRKTVCLSTQVGCKFACAFCASGFKGFKRNLTASEILSQILFIKHSLKHKISNYVFMGIGEPLDNYDSLVRSIIIMNCPDGLYIGSRRITVSTCGIIPGIQKIKRLGLQIDLSVSLHAVDNKLRSSLMPVNRKYPLERLLEACEDYIKHTNRKITLEYVLIKGINDSLRDAKGLSEISKRLNSKVNLIPYSPVSVKRFKVPSRIDIKTFKDRLVKNRVNVTVRESKGKDIQAACGQLVAHLVRDRASDKEIIEQ